MPDDKTLPDQHNQAHAAVLLMAAFGENLRLLRRERGLSQAKLAEMVQYAPIP